MFTRYGCSPVFSEQLESLLPTNKTQKFDDIQRLVFNLTMNGSFLLKKYTPAQLLALNDDMLAENSDIEREKLVLQEKCANYKALIEKDFFTDQGLSPAENCVSCRYCGKQWIDFTTKQTRSADEGSTVFLSCSNVKCQKRWKM